MDDRTHADDKKKLRKEILSIRDAMTEEERKEKSFRILQSVYDMEQFRDAKIILAYADYRSEVITEPLILKSLAEGKSVFCPKVEGGDMEFYRITDIGDLKEGYKGIREPACGHAFMDSNHSEGIFMLMPGVVFDKSCHRIGYGKGFYDRYMTRLSENGIRPYTVALCYECQLVSNVPYEVHDMNPEAVITEEEIYFAKIRD